LEQRKQQLGLFLNTFLAHPLIKGSKLVPVYFKSRQTGEGSADAIEQLVLFMNGNATTAGRSPMIAKKPTQKPEDVQ
jgi:hypothetical protein